MEEAFRCRPLKKAARQGGEPAKKGVYLIVNDRILQATPTQQAENPSALFRSEGFFAFAAFVSGLRPSESVLSEGLSFAPGGGYFSCSACTSGKAESMGFSFDPRNVRFT